LYTKRKAQALEGKKLPENLRAKAITFREIAKDALAYARAHNSHLASYDGRMEVVLGWFGDRPADGITPQEIDRQLTETGEDRKWAAATINRYKALISLCYTLAMKNGKLTANPARLVKHRQENNGRIRFLSAEEEMKLRAAIRRRHVPEFEIAINTGMRLSEQYTLERVNVSLERKSVTVQQSKNGTARHIPLNARALAALKWVLESHSAAQVFPHHANATKGHAPRWFGSAVEKAGITPITWHGLRHTFASRLVMAGVDIRTVQELMGHKSILMTMRYAHLAPDHQRAAVEKLDGEKPSATTTATQAKAQTVTLQ
ncbi:MAG TPA: site-specific integrase, partial [Terriglobales bacterium]|nr:site-specific integrase [Terriglobales bacterium]